MEQLEMMKAMLEAALNDTRIFGLERLPDEIRAFNLVVDGLAAEQQHDVPPLKLIKGGRK